MKYQKATYGKPWAYVKNGRGGYRKSTAKELAELQAQFKRAVDRSMEEISPRGAQ